MEYAKKLFELLKLTFKEWQEDGATRLAAALAYYTAFSLAPLLVIIIGIVSFFVDAQTVQSTIIEQINTTIGSDAAEFVDGLIASRAETGEGIISTILGIGALIFGALGVFTNLQTALDIIWDVPAEDRPSGIKGFIKDKVLSFGGVIVVGFLLLVSLVLSTVLSYFDARFLGGLPVQFLARIISFVISFGITTLLFAIVYKFLPHAVISWRDVIVGAAGTSALFTIGRFLLGVYLAQSGTSSIYGAAGAFVLILLWVYYSAQIILFGAEFTQVFARLYGSRIISDADYAENDGKVTVDEIEPDPSVPKQRVFMRRNTIEQGRMMQTMGAALEVEQKLRMHQNDAPAKKKEGMMHKSVAEVIAGVEEPTEEEVIVVEEPIEEGEGIPKPLLGAGGLLVIGGLYNWWASRD